MYYYLHGVVNIHLKNSIVIECNGVGYEVIVSHPFDYTIGSTIRLYTSFYSREDEQFLVGFQTFEEKALYEKLVQVKGVGPKLAMSILGGASVSRILKAIEESDLMFLKKLPNVGPKTASQIILDLKGKLTIPNLNSTGNKELDDAIVGLKNMGFSSTEISSAINEIPTGEFDTEDYLKMCLALLGRGR